jgi:hypothetical protein
VQYLLPYREQGNPPVLRPIVDVRLEYEDVGDWTCQALVDSGAPRTVFDRGAADAIGVRMNNAGAKSIVIRLLGDTWPAQLETVDISLPAIPRTTWSTEVAFVKNPEFRMPFQGVLGTEGFLDRFAVTFNVYHNYFVIETADEFHQRVGQHLISDPVTASDPQWERPTAS